MSVKYALNLAENGRVLSATYPQYAPKDAQIVDHLPDGDIADYLYINGEFVFDPLPRVEEVLQITYEERVAALEMALLELMGVSQTDIPTQEDSNI